MRKSCGAWRMFCKMKFLNFLCKHRLRCGRERAHQNSTENDKIVTFRKYLKYPASERTAYFRSDIFTVFMILLILVSKKVKRWICSEPCWDTLHVRIRAAPVPQAIGELYATQLAEGLAYIHANHLVPPPTLWKIFERWRKARPFEYGDIMLTNSTDRRPYFCRCRIPKVHIQMSSAMIAIACNCSCIRNWAFSDFRNF